MLKFLEMVWLVIAVFSVVLVGSSLFMPGFTSYDTMWFSVIALVAVGMYFVRRKQRTMRERAEGKNLR